jgi:hypothetical protein
MNYYLMSLRFKVQRQKTDTEWNLFDFWWRLCMYLKHPSNTRVHGYRPKYYTTNNFNLLFTCHACWTKNICNYNIVIHRIWAVLQSDWLNYSPYISSYTASSEKQDGGRKTTWVLWSRKKENIRFEKDNSTRKNSQKILTGWQNTFIT